MWPRGGPEADRRKIALAFLQIKSGHCRRLVRILVRFREPTLPMRILVVSARIRTHRTMRPGPAKRAHPTQENAMSKNHLTPPRKNSYSSVPS